jgi:hypothetical protein
VNVFVTALLLILPISALAARRLPLGAIVKMALMWVAIFAVLIAVVMLWQQGVGHA